MPGGPLVLNAGQPSRRQRCCESMPPGSPRRDGILREPECDPSPLDQSAIALGSIAYSVTGFVLWLDS